jgi:hypothetical protein
MTGEWLRIGGVPAADGAPELPAAGTWRIEHTEGSLKAQGLDEAAAKEFAGIVTLDIGDGRWSFEETWGQGRLTSVCGGTYALDDGRLVLTFDTNAAECGTAPTAIIWRADGPDAAVVTAAPGGAEEPWVFIGNWTRLGDAPSQSPAVSGMTLPPSGVYRMELTLEEALAAGASMGWAVHDLAGTNTLEIDGDRGIWRLRPSEPGSRGPRDDGFAIRVEGDHVVFDGTGTGYRTIDTLTWRMDGDLLIIDVIAVSPTVEFEFDRILLETKPWLRIGDVGSQ